jgi:hypothetical protein
LENRRETFNEVAAVGRKGGGKSKVLEEKLAFLQSVVIPAFLCNSCYLSLVVIPAQAAVFEKEYVSFSIGGNGVVLTKSFISCTAFVISFLVLIGNKYCLLFGYYSPS